MGMDVWCFVEANEPHQNNILNFILHQQDSMFQIMEVLKSLTYASSVNSTYYIRQMGIPYFLCLVIPFEDEGN